MPIYGIHGERLGERGVEEVTRDEIITLSKMHEIAANRHMTLVCQHCDSAFTGRNNDAPNTPALAISCKCRELRFTRRG